MLIRHLWGHRVRVHVVQCSSSQYDSFISLHHLPGREGFAETVLTSDRNVDSSPPGGLSRQDSVVYLAAFGLLKNEADASAMAKINAANASHATRWSAERWVP